MIGHSDRYRWSAGGDDVGNAQLLRKCQRQAARPESLHETSTVWSDLVDDSFNVGNIIYQEGDRPIDRSPFDGEKPGDRVGANESGRHTIDRVGRHDDEPALRGYT